MKRAVDTLIALIILVGIAAIVDFAAHRPIFEQVQLIALWLLMIAVGAVVEIVDIVVGRNAERNGPRPAQLQPMRSDAVNPEQSAPRLAA